MTLSFTCFFGDKGKASTKFLCIKKLWHHRISRLPLPTQTAQKFDHKCSHYKEGAKIEAAAVEVKVKLSLSMTQLSRKLASMKEMIKQFDQQSM